MPDPSRSDLRLYERALRNGWDIPASTRADVIRVLGEIVADDKARRRDRTAAARGLLQASRVELEAIRVAQAVQFEDLARAAGGAGGGRRWRTGRMVEARIERLERRRGKARDRSAESVRFDWYAAGCPCGVPPGECREHPRARPAQRPPAGDWRTWLLLMGRGAGKTRSAAEWVRHRVETGAARRIALVGATAADVRDVMVEGPSGLLAVCPPWDRPRYEPSKRRLTWPNGAVATTFSADEPDRLRGPQTDCAWIDELAAFRYPAAVDNLLFGLRLGADPRLCVTTTPKPVRLVTELVVGPDDGDRAGHDLREPEPTWRRRSSSGS